MGDVLLEGCPMEHDAVGGGVEPHDQDIGSLVLSRFQTSTKKGDLQLCAVVGTIAQELKDHGVPLSPVAYFGAAYSTLDRLSRDSSSGSDPSTKALLTFFSMVLAAVPPAVLRSKAVVVGETLVRILEFQTASEGTITVALRCLARLLQEGDKANWAMMEPFYKVLLSFASDKRDKVRMLAHSCTCDILKSLKGAPVLSSASEIITTMFERFLLLAGGSNSTCTTAEGPRGVWEVLFILNALKDSLPLMSNKFRTKILKYFKSLLGLTQPIVTRAIMEILHSLCCSSTVEFPAEILLDLLCSLASSGSGKEKSADAMASTARLLHFGTKKVHDMDSSICAVKLPVIFHELGEILASEHEEAIHAAAEAFKVLISSCIDQCLIEQGVDQISMNGKGIKRKSEPTIIEKICVTIEAILGYQYNAIWDISFQIISTMFDRSGESSFYLMAGIVKSLANLERLSDEDLDCRKQLHECVGSAVRAMGPEMFLELLPFNLEADELSEANTWLLPIMKQNIVGAKLSFFNQYILNIARHLKRKAQKLENEGLILSARTTDGIVFSLWSLLPAFCNYPSDTASSFKDLHGHLCNALTEESELRGLICSSLQILIQQNNRILGENDEPVGELNNYEQKAKSRYTVKLAEENLNSIRSTSNKIFQVLSKIFMESSKDTGGCLQSTMREFASISNEKDVRISFKLYVHELYKVTEEAIKAVRDGASTSMQIDSSSGEISLSRKRALLLDLAVSLLPGLGKKEIALLYSCIKLGLKENDGVVQKKAYKTLATILKERDEFLSTELDNLLELMMDAQCFCHFSSKRHRLDSLSFLLVYVSKDPSEQRKKKIIGSFLAEIVLALKEGNKKTRNRAFDLLVEIGHACVDDEHGGNKLKLEEFFEMVAGGLAGDTPHMISAAIKGLARLAYEFSDLVNAAYSLLPSAFLLLQRKNRVICKASLGLVKVLVARSQADWLHIHLNSVVDGLMKWQDGTKNQFKAKVKLLLGMLIKKCGLDAVKAVMPEEHMKLLTNIRKTAERKERKAKSEDTKSINSKTSSSEFDKSRSFCSKSSSSKLSRWNHTKIFSDIDDDDDSDAGYTYSRTISGFQSKRPYALTSKSSLRSKRLKNSSKTLPGDLFNQLEEDPLDLLDRQKTRSALKSFPSKRKEEPDDEPEIDSDGRLIIHEDRRRPKKEKGHSSDNEQDRRSNAGSHMSAPSLKGSQRKRQKTTESGWAYTGSEYTSKKASGDVKRKDKLEPYAYWPLDRKLLNRREDNKAMARKGMASVIKATKKLEGKSAAAALSIKGLKLKKNHKKGTKKHKK